MSFVLDSVLISAKWIADIEVSLMIEETHTDELEITESPVELGAAITDHSYSRPAEVTLQCGWSNSDLKALTGTIVALFNGEMPSAQYIDSVYSQLLALQQSRLPFDLTTSRRKYRNMLMQSLIVRKDPKTGAALMVTATLREIIIVSTQATTLPPREDQASPEKTAETQDAGVKSAAPATPAPGGSVPPSQW